ncbi:RNA polymerase sigma factor [Colwellia sp. BRX10-3]|nr:RNA polymerase sigma factor [Colwellia sp. BRX10-3]
MRSIMKMSVEQQDVDDILQETFIRVLDSDAKQQIKSPKGYLFVVSRNLVLKKLMQQSKEIHTELDDALIEDDDENTVEKDLYQKLKFERFNKVLSSLPEKHRRAILLRKLYCLSHKEIAKKMDVSVSSIEKYIAQGLKQCKQSLCAQGYEVDELKLPVHLNQSSEEQTK